MIHFMSHVWYKNHQLNHLPPTNLKNLYHLASSEFSRHFTKKTSPVTLTVFSINPLGNYTCTDRHTHILKFLLGLICNTSQKIQSINITQFNITIALYKTRCQKAHSHKNNNLLNTIQTIPIFKLHQYSNSTHIQTHN